MDHDTLIKMVEAMHCYGGGFVYALAECFIIADNNNLERLLKAFPEIVKQYLEMAKSITE